MKPIGVWRGILLVCLLQLAHRTAQAQQCSDRNILITSLSSPVIFIDTKLNGLHQNGFYVGYRIVSLSQSATSLWVSIDSFFDWRQGKSSPAPAPVASPIQFQPGMTTAVTLNMQEDGIVKLGAWNGEAIFPYYYLRGRDDGTPDTPTYYDYTTWRIQLWEGGLVLMTVSGNTGNTPVGGIFAGTPAVLDDWPANCFQLYDASINFTNGANMGVWANRLYVNNMNAGESSFLLTYKFRIVKLTTAVYQVYPSDYVTSGQVIKHTDPDPKSFTPLPMSGVSVDTIISKSVSSISPLGTVSYTITLNNNISALATNMDIFIDGISDVLPLTPSDMSFVPGTFAETTNGTTRNISSSITFNSATNSLLLDSIIVIPAGTSRTFTYTAQLPTPPLPGTYINQAFGLIDGSPVFDNDTDPTTLYPASASFTINDKPPVAIPDSVSVTEDDLAGVQIFPLVNDWDPDGDDLVNITYSPPACLTIAPICGTLILVGTTFTFIPAANFAGTVVFYYAVTDTAGSTSCTLPITISCTPITITVIPVNDPPVPFPDTTTTTENTPVSISTLLDNDVDIDGNALVIVGVTQPTSGQATVFLNPDGSVTYTPIGSYSNTPTTRDTFTYTVSDGYTTLSTTVTVTVNSFNDAPTARIDCFTVTEGTAGNVLDLVSNDYDPEGNTISINSVTAPALGSITATSATGVTYTAPSVASSTSTTFTYVVQDDGSPVGTSASTTVTILIIADNDIPVANDDSIAVTQNTAEELLSSILSNDGDVNGDTITLLDIISAPSSGYLVFGANTLTYIPWSYFTGIDTFTYRITDGFYSGSLSISNIATVNLTVDDTAPNRAPISLADYSTAIDSVASNIMVLTNDYDPDGDTLTVFTVTSETNGTAVLNANYVTFTPTNGTATATFMYRPTDGSLQGASVMVTLIVTSSGVPTLNTDPTAVGETVNVGTELVSVPVLDNDSNGGDGGSLTLEGIIQGATYGTAAVSNPFITYQRNTALVTSASDSVRYQISDTIEAAISTITVTNNPIPVADFYSCVRSTSCSWDVTGNDQDPDGGSISLAATPDFNCTSGCTIVSSIVASGANNITVTLNGVSGTTTYTYNVVDNEGYTAQSTLTIVSTNNGLFIQPPSPVNNGPTTVTPGSSTAFIDLISDDSDPGGLALTLNGVSAPTEGYIEISGNTAKYYAPVSPITASQTVRYNVKNSGGNSAYGYWTINFSGTAANTAPVGVTDYVQDVAAASITISPLTNDYDLTPSTISIQSASTGNGSVIVSGTDLVYTPPSASYTGNVVITYVPTDGTNAGASTDVFLNVVGSTGTSLSDTAPTAYPDYFSVAADSVGITFDPISNDYDADGNTLSLVGITGYPSYGSVSVSGNTITYVPFPRFSGTEMIGYQVADGLKASTGTITIIVTPINYSPYARDDRFIFTEDSASFNLPVTLNDYEANSEDTLRVSSVATGIPFVGTFAITPSGALRFTPDADFYTAGQTFTYTVSDGTTTSTATGTLVITNINDAPEALSDYGSISQSSILVLSVLDNDYDIDSPSINVVSVSSPTPGGGTALITGGGTTITYTPNANFIGTDTISYLVSDGCLTASAIIYVTVTNSNTSPTITDDAIITPEDTLVTYDIVVNDVDPDGDTLRIWEINQPTHGKVVINPDGTITYTPNPGYSGPDSFTYRVTDGSSTTGLGLVSLTLLPQNDPPVANDDYRTTPLNTPVAISVLQNDYDTDSPPDVISLVGVSNGPTKGNVSTSGGVVTYTPYDGFTGTDSFMYTITDGTLTTTALVYVTVGGTNTPPVAQDDARSTPEDTPVTFNVIGNDYDPDGDTISLVGLSPTDLPDFGTIVTSSSGVITYTPNSNYYSGAVDTFDYIITDGKTTTTAKVTITVTPANDPPTANLDIATTNEEVPVTISVLNNDMDPEFDTLTVLSVVVLIAILPNGVVVSAGTAVIQPSGAILFTPTADVTGLVTLTYTITDGQATSTASILITIIDINDSPVLAADFATTPEDTPFTFVAGTSVLNNDYNAEGNNLLTVLGVSTLPSQGTISVNTVTNNITYTPDPNFFGTDTFYYVASDGVVTATQLVTVTVTPVNDPPTANPDFITVTEDTPRTFSVITNDVDPDTGDTLTMITVGTSSQGKGITTLNSDGTITYTPIPNAVGNDTFTYTITDSYGQTSSSIVYIYINNVNDNPVAIDDYSAVSGTTPVSILVTTNDYDVDLGTTLTVIGWSFPSKGNVTQSGNNLTFTPTVSFVPGTTDSFEYWIQDGNGAMAFATVYLVGTPAVNSPPDAVDDTYSVNEDTLTSLDVLTNDSDDGIVLALRITQITVFPSNGTFSIVGGTTVDYTPYPGHRGPDTFTYLITDGVDTDTAVVTITVIAVNHPPVAVNDAETMDEDSGWVTIDILDNDHDDTSTLAVADITVTTSPANGATRFFGGAFQYRPNDNYNGVDTLQYTVLDGDGAVSNIATVTITINAINDPPQAADDEVLVSKNIPKAFNVITNDVEPDGQILTVTGYAASSNLHGTIAWASNGDFTYTPDTGFLGNVTFTYTITDGVTTDTATVTLVVTGANDPPVGVDDSITIVEGSGPAAILAIDNDYDVNSDTITILSVDPIAPADGSFSIIAGGTQLLYTPPSPDFSGVVTTTYILTDSKDSSSPVTVTVYITDTPDPPVAVDDTLVVTEDVPLQFDLADIMGNDYDPDGPSPTFNSILVYPSDGTLTYNAVTQKFLYTPSPNYNSPDVTFLYEISDGTFTDTALVTLSFIPVNDPPDAIDDIVHIFEDESLVGYDILANDIVAELSIDQDILSLVNASYIVGSGNPVVLPGAFSYTIGPGGLFSFIPAPNYFGTLLFEYTITDGVNEDTALITVIVDPTNDDVVAVDDVAVTNSSMPVLIPVTFNDYDPDIPDQTITINRFAGSPSNGALFLVNSTTVKYVPNAGFFGLDFFFVEITDGYGYDISQVTVTVYSPASQNLEGSSAYLSQRIPNQCALNGPYSPFAASSDNVLSFELGVPSKLQSVITLLEGQTTFLVHTVQFPTSGARLDVTSYRVISGENLSPKPLVPSVTTVGAPFLTSVVLDFGNVTNLFDDSLDEKDQIIVEFGLTPNTKSEFKSQVTFSTVFQDPMGNPKGNLVHSKVHVSSLQENTIQEWHMRLQCPAYTEPLEFFSVVGVQYAQEWGCHRQTTNIGREVTTCLPDRQVLTPLWARRAFTLNDHLWSWRDLVNQIGPNAYQNCTLTLFDREYHGLLQFIVYELWPMQVEVVTGCTMQDIVSDGTASNGRTGNAHGHTQKHQMLYEDVYFAHQGIHSACNLDFTNDLPVNP